MDRNQQLFFSFWPGITNSFHAAVKHCTWAGFHWLQAEGLCTASLAPSTLGFAFSLLLLRSPRWCCWDMARVPGRKIIPRDDGGSYLFLSLVVLHSQFWCLPNSNRALALSLCQHFTTWTISLSRQTPLLGQMIVWDGDEWHQAGLSGDGQGRQCAWGLWGVGGWAGTRIR